MIQGMMHMHLDVALPEKWLPEKIRTGDSHFIMGMNIFLFFLSTQLFPCIDVSWISLRLSFPYCLFYNLWSSSVRNGLHRKCYICLCVCVYLHTVNGPAWPRNISDVLSNQGLPMWVILLFFIFFPPIFGLCQHFLPDISLWAAELGTWWPMMTGEWQPNATQQAWVTNRAARLLSVHLSLPEILIMPNLCWRLNSVTPGGFVRAKSTNRNKTKGLHHRNLLG